MKGIYKALFYFSISASLINTACTKKPNSSTTTILSEATVTPVAAAIPPKEVPVWAPKKFNYNPSRTILNDVLHTRIDASFNWESSTMNGTATITAKPHFFPQNTLVLDAQDFDIKHVKQIKGKKIKPASYVYKDNVLTIQLDSTYGPSQQYTVEIEYVANPERTPAVGSAAISDAKGLYFINPKGLDKNKPKQIWTQGETQSNSKWFPCVDSPNEKSTQETHITVDTAYVTLSNGALTASINNGNGTRTDVWEHKQPHSMYLFMMAVGKFKIVKDKWKGMEVNYYVEPAYEKYGKQIFGNTPEMLEFFSNKLGVKYPWAKYSQIVVRDYVSGAMENTTATIMGENVQVTDLELADANWDGIIAHELFHHWFGDLVTAESWSNLPLNESFANYSEYLWKEYKYGKVAAQMENEGELRQYLAESATKREPLIRYYYKDREDMFDSHSYAKGGRVLNLLRYTVGDDAFFSSLKLYLTRNQYKAAEISQLRLAFEEVTGRDLHWFFDQYFMVAGHPQLDAKHSFSNGQLTVTINQMQDTLYSPKYKLPLQIAVYTSTGEKRFSIDADSISNTFKTALSEEPKLVIIDPDKVLPGVINQPLSESELVYAAQNATHIVYRLRASKQLLTLNKEKGLSNISNLLKSNIYHEREYGLQLIEDLDSISQISYLPSIENIAKSDPKTTVRAAAIDQLAKTKSKIYLPLYLSGIEVKSLAVSSASLNAYVGLKGAESEKLIKRFEADPFKRYADVVGGYYANLPGPESNAWFKTQLESASGQSFVSLFQNYGAYLRKADAATQADGINILLTKLKEAKGIEAKIYGFMALTPLSEDHPNLKTELQKMASDEKEGMVKMYMNMILNQAK